MNTQAQDDRGSFRPLASLLVIELGARVGAGACGGLLAQLGADVILVEPPAPRRDHKWRNRSACAANKRSVVVDEHEKAGQGLIAALLARADIVLLSSDLSGFERQAWDALRPARQIICDITAFGHEGPLAGKPLSEALVQAYSAVLDTTGPRDGEPAPTGAPFLDMEAAVYAAASIVAALHVRRRTGSGQRIDIALFDVGVNALLTFIPLHLIGRPATRGGNRHPTLTPWNSYRAADGWVLICGPTNDQWARLCRAMGRRELIDDRAFATPSLRLERIDEIDRIVGAWVERLSVADCVATLTAAGIPSGPIVETAKLAEEPNLRHRGMIAEARDPESDSAVKVSGTPLRAIGRPLPAAAVPRRDADRAGILALLDDTPAAPALVRGDPALAGPALAGLRVVEIGMNTVGPLAARQLGALGADVIKVEPPTGDTNRLNAPLRGDGRAFVFQLSNTDKRGLVLDLRRAEDKATLFRLLPSADIVIENLKPGSLGKLGVGAADVTGRFPHIVYCSVNGFGHDSVYPGRPALDTVIQGMSGAMSATTLDGVPTKAGISISDQLGGQFGLLAVLAATYDRPGGRGVAFDIAMQDCSAWATQILWAGRAHDDTACRIVEAADGFVAIAGTAEALRRRVPEDSAETLASLRRMSRASVVASFDGARDCAAAPVLRVAEVLDHPQVASRGLFIERPMADGAPWMVLGSPMRLLGTPPEVRSTMPALGHLDSALARELGLTATAPEATGLATDRVAADA